MTGDTFHSCNRETCDPKFVAGPKTSCIKCGKTCFLQCYGFEKCGLAAVKLNLLFSSCVGLDPSSISFTCPNCDSVFLDDVVNTKMEAAPFSTPSGHMLNKTPKQTKMTTNVNDSPSTSSVNPLITYLRTDVGKLSKKVEYLIDVAKSHSLNTTAVKEICTETNTVVKTLCDKSSEQHVVLNTVVDKFKASNQKACLSPSSLFSSEDFPEYRNNNKRKRQNESPTKPSFSQAAKNMNSRPKSNDLNDDVKLAVKKRQLLSGNSSNHGLGDAISLEKPTSTKAPRPQMKSMYVSRIQNSITADDLTKYIKSNATVVNDTDLSVRLLVKKDQPIEKLSFVSFRVSCTSELHTKLFDPAFWPKHVRIGEFFDNPRPKRAELGDFFTKPMTNDASHSSEAGNPINVNASEATVTSDEQKNANSNGNQADSAMETSA